MSVSECHFPMVSHIKKGQTAAHSLNHSAGVSMNRNNPARRCRNKPLFLFAPVDFIVYPPKPYLSPIIANPFWGNKQQEQEVTMLTPVKAIKGEDTIITQREKAGRDLFSIAVSKVRQPIESFFNWLSEKTNIQRAMKVRSTPGLLVRWDKLPSHSFI